MTFLTAVAADIYKRYGETISSLTIVFPSRRAQMFFSEALSQIIDKPVWEPQYLSPDELISGFCELKQTDDFDLIVKLYQAYIKHTESDETFGNFYFWGETLLKDFNDIDKYLIDTRMLLKNVADQKQMEGDYSFLTDEQIQYVRKFWSAFDPEKKSTLQNKFVEIWDVLLPIYSDFNEALKSESLAYTGMIYRQVAQDAINNKLPVPGSKIILAGFNALSESEIVLFKFLKQSHVAEFYWDYDNYYLDDEMHEAGKFMRENIKNFPMPDGFELKSQFLSADKDIQIIQTPSDAVMAKAIPIVSENMPLNRNTAIVLIDQALLIPVLYSLPENVDDVNITLGYPFKQTQVYTLAELLIRMQSRPKSDIGNFYHKDVVAVLRHKYVKAFEPELADHIIDHIKRYNKIYLTRKYFADKGFFVELFAPAQNCFDFIDYLQKIFSKIATQQSGNDTQDALMREYIFNLSKSLTRLKTSLLKLPDVGKPVFLKLLRDIFKELKVPFYGEPLKGLQITGLPETRGIDFENVIVMSVNEGKIPADAYRPTFIPYNLRRGYGLPVPENDDAITAYAFYRLLQRAKNIRLLYSSKTDESRTGEQSRYLYRLKFESKLKITEYSLSFNVSFNHNAPLTVPKNEQVMLVLNKFLSQNEDSPSLSPSALSVYISCPLQFYYSRIAGIKPSEEVQEELAINAMGNIIHKVMETLYASFLNKPASASEINNILQNKTNINHLIDTYFAQEFYKTERLPDDFTRNGKLLITRDVIQKYVEGVLKYDMANAGFTLLGFEKSIKDEQNFAIHGKQYIANLRGIIDRIDKYQGSVRIIDYKTGAGRGRFKRNKFTGVESLFSPDPDIRNKEAFQTFVYSLLYKRKTNEQTPLVPALYFVRDCNSPEFDYRLIDNTDYKKRKTVNDFTAFEEEFKELLCNLLKELFDEQIPFTGTDYKKTCKICDYKQICGKTV